MAYPSIEEYQILVQNPSTTFTDKILATGTVATSGMGTPKVVSGGFALTYAVNTRGKVYAVRCFHKEAKGLERRYAAISHALAALKSKYFVEFEYQAQGVRANQATYPLVKMAWASGETLGEFVESNFDNPAALKCLITSLNELAAYLESTGVAHGDIQEGNLMVSNGGLSIQLIDYDGMFVPALSTLGGAELGHRDYQHPGRDSSHYGVTLDRFSFISLTLSLRALCARPQLWMESQSGGGVIVLRANDFADPGSSPILAKIAQVTGFAQDVKNFLSVCAAPFERTPSLRDFNTAANIPTANVRMVAPNERAAASGYISQYPVLNGTDYDAFETNVGQMVELVGKIVEVKFGFGVNRKPYIFLNFGDWRKKSVKIALWSEVLSTGSNVPTAEWKGRWVTIRGLVEPVYKRSYESIALTASTLAQISTLTETEALYRLTPFVRRTPTPQASTNADTLRRLGGGSPGQPQSPAQSSPANRTAVPPTNPVPRTPVPTGKPLTANQAALARLQSQAPSAPPPKPAPAQPARTSVPPKPIQPRGSIPPSRSAHVPKQNPPPEGLGSLLGKLAKWFFS